MAEHLSSPVTLHYFLYYSQLEQLHYSLYFSQLQQKVSLSETEMLVFHFLRRVEIRSSGLNLKHDRNIITVFNLSNSDKLLNKLTLFFV